MSDARASAASTPRVRGGRPPSSHTPQTQVRAVPAPAEDPGAQVRANQAATINASVALGLLNNNSGSLPAALRPPTPLEAGTWRAERNRRGVHNPDEGSSSSPALRAHTATSHTGRNAALNTRLGNLYSAFWRMLEAAIASMQDARTLGPTLAESAAMQTFTDLTATSRIRPPAEPVVSGLDAMNSAFAQLAPPAQNVLLALLDVNMRLTAQEAQLHHTMSSAYHAAAQQAMTCVMRAIDTAVAWEAAQADRIDALHAQAVQRLLGNKYAWLVTKTSQVLQQLATAGVSVDVEPDAAGNASAMLCQLQSVKRALAAELTAADERSTRAAVAATATASSAAIATATTTKESSESAAAADMRLAVRMERHALATRKAAEIARLRHDPYELARVLRYFAASDDELLVALASALGASSRPLTPGNLAGAAAIPNVDVEPSSVDTSGELAAMMAAVSDMIDQAHIVAADAQHVRAALERQVRAELAADIEAARAATAKRLAELQRQLAQTQADALSAHERAVAAAVSAERTLASELTHFGAGAPMQICLRAVSDAAQLQRHHRDACALHDHKSALHDLALLLRGRLQR